MAYSRFSRRRPYFGRRRSYGRRSYSSYSRPRRSYSRVGIFRRRRMPKRVRSNRVQAQDGCGPCKSDMTSGDKFVLAQADPFLPKAFGGKIPDSSTIPSVPTPIQWNQSLTSVSGGVTQPAFAHAWAFYPSVTGSFVTARGLSANSWDWTGAGTGFTNAPARANFLVNFEATRTVAHGIRLSCPFAPTAATGFVHIAIATETTWNSAAVAQYTQLATDLSQMSGYTFYKRVTLASLTQSPITLVNKWTDETAFRYQSPEPNAANDATTTGNTFTVPYSWGTLLVAVEGVSTITSLGPVVTPLQAEVVLHTENIPQKNGALTGSMAAAYDSTTLNAVSRGVAGSDFAHTEQEQDSYIGSYFGTVAEAAAEAGERLAPVLQSAMRTAGRNMMEGAVNAAGQFIFGVGGVNNLPNRLAIR